MSILSLICVSIPLGCVLAFHFGYGINGFWMAYAIRSFILAVIYYYYLWFNFDWSFIAKEAIKRELMNSAKRDEDAELLKDGNLFLRDANKTLTYGSTDLNEDIEFSRL